MNLNQVFKYLDSNLSPDKGGKVQISINKDTKKETISIFIFNKEINSYSYIFVFTKENIDNIDTFSSVIKSGYSGIDYKLGIALDDALYNSIKEAVITSDAIYMKYLEAQIDGFEEETVPVIDEVVNAE